MTNEEALAKIISDGILRDLDLLAGGRENLLMTIHDIKEERLGADFGVDFIRLAHIPTGIYVEGDSDRRYELIKELCELLREPL